MGATDGGAELAGNEAADAPVVTADDEGDTVVATAATVVVVGIVFESCLLSAEVVGTNLEGGIGSAPRRSHTKNQPIQSFVRSFDGAGADRACGVIASYHNNQECDRVSTLRPHPMQYPLLDILQQACQQG